MRITISDLWRVDAEHSIHVRLPASAAWGQVRDVTHFLTLDPLHARIQCSPPPANGDWRGVRLRISHRLFGIGPDRVGRVLVWEEGRRIVFSDLSSRGFDRGFPHVCGCEIESTGSSTCRISFSARGKWTATWIPRWVIKLWILWVLLSTGNRVRYELRSVARMRGTVVA